MKNYFNPMPLRAGSPGANLTYAGQDERVSPTPKKDCGCGCDGTKCSGEMAQWKVIVILAAVIMLAAQLFKKIRS